MKKFAILSSFALLGAVSLASLSAKPAIAGCGWGDITCNPKDWTCPVGGCPPKPGPNPYLTQANDSVIYNSYVFDPAWYLKKYQDLREEYGRNNIEGAKSHWKKFGVKECRQGSPGFNPKFYLEKYPDVAKAYNNSCEGAMSHWIKFGIKEGRRGVP